MRVFLTFLLAATLTAAISILPACETVIPEFDKAEVRIVGDTILIVDNLGKEWDITHAVKVFRMSPQLFEHGLGQDAIRPLLEPQMFSEGDLGYPASDKTFMVIGAKFGTDIRSYKVEDLNTHEVVNERFGDTLFVAVGW